MDVKFLSVLCLASLAASGAAEAQKLYKYKDENGVWQYSDKKPSGVADARLEQLEMRASNEKALFKQAWIREDADEDPSLMVVNKYSGPILATVSYKCDLCKVQQGSKTVFVHANSVLKAVDLYPKNQDVYWSATYNLSVSLGDPKAVPDPEAVYGLPYPMDQFFLITQSFNGKFSHQDQYNRYAIDVAMPIGTPILAARDGVVMAVEEGYKHAGVSKDYADKANIVYILHDDGTLALYAHLDMGAVQVKVGDKVERGEQIARSGNTGFSTGPHLHFNVQKNTPQGEVSIPYVFDKGKGETFVPLAGEELKWDIYSRVISRVSQEHKALYQASVAEQKSEQTQAQAEYVKDKVKGFFKQFLE